MFKKKDLDKLLTLVRKWHREHDPELENTYLHQALALVDDIAKETTQAYRRNLFWTADRVAANRWTNEEFYAMIERTGKTVER